MNEQEKLSFMKGETGLRPASRTENGDQEKIKLGGEHFFLFH